MERPRLTTADHIRGNLYTVRIEKTQPFTRLARTVWNIDQGRVAQFRAGVAALTRPFDGIGIPVTEALYSRYHDATHLPFADQGIQSHSELIGFGGESFVYRINDTEVLKVDRESVDKSVPEQLTRANVLRSANEELQQLYADLPGFIQPAKFVIGQFPFMDKPAVGHIQPYIPDGKGLFEDHSYEELASLIETYPKFRRDMSTLASTYFDHLEQTQSGIDLGVTTERNIRVTDEREGKKLVLVDACSTIDRKSLMENNRIFTLFQAREHILAKLHDHAIGIL